MSGEQFNRLTRFYLVIQLAIWAKVAIFYVLIGVGATEGYMKFFNAVFAADGVSRVLAIASISPYAAFDIVFHGLAHGLITLCLFLFVRDATKLDLEQLMPLFLAAVVLHNVGYWFTGVMHSSIDIYLDFLNDLVLLFIFAYGFRLALRLLPRLKSVRIPFLD